MRCARVGALSTTLCPLVLAGFNLIELWMVVGVAFVQGIVRAIEIPADQALLANVVPPSDIANAV